MWTPSLPRRVIVSQPPASLITDEGSYVASAPHLLDDLAGAARRGRRRLHSDDRGRRLAATA
jgi:hypothetical protein